VVVGAMGAQNAVQFFKRGVLLITPATARTLLLAACTCIDEAAQDEKWRASC
jgi:BioD-like phosphotransacetylase family protein